MEMTCRSEEEVCSALHDCDNDMAKACEMLLEQADQTQVIVGFLAQNDPDRFSALIYVSDFLRASGKLTKKRRRRPVTLPTPIPADREWRETATNGRPEAIKMELQHRAVQSVRVLMPLLVNIGLLEVDLQIDHVIIDHLSLLNTSFWFHFID